MFVEEVKSGSLKLQKQKLLSKVILLFFAIMISFHPIQIDAQQRFQLLCEQKEVDLFYCGSGKKKTRHFLKEGRLFPPSNAPIYTALYHFYPDDFLTHRGVDMIGSEVILASGPGIVVDRCGNSCDGPFGNYVIVQHDEQLFTLYAHLSTVHVTHGEMVMRESLDIGTKIGIMGDTGAAFGRHLHFEVRSSSSHHFQFRQDPISYIDVYISQCNNMFGLQDALNNPRGPYKDYYAVNLEGKVIAI